MDKFIWFLLTFALLLCNCGSHVDSAAPSDQPAVVTPQPASSVKSTENSSECVRSEPEPVVKKDVFPNTSFRLETNKEFPYQKLGYETVEFKNGDRLLIEHAGCENFTLIFRFETKRFAAEPADVRFWYRAAVELMSEAEKGIAKSFLIPQGLKALNTYPTNDKQLEFDKQIDFGTGEIRSVVSVNDVKKLANDRYEIAVAFGTGPL